MIHFDISRSSRQNHRSGLTRVTGRLLEEFGTAVRPAALFQTREGLEAFSKQVTAADWWLTAELFCEEECPGLWQFIRSRPCRLAAVYHDAIPLKLPHITWPKSVSRHAEYMKMLASFDRVFAVSEASRRELLEFWEWQNVEARAAVETVELGADFTKQARRTVASEGGDVICVGILEPRKNQRLLLEVCERLWRRGLMFDLHLVGRVNPHFGHPTVEHIRELQRTWRCVHFHESATDETLRKLYAGARINAFPTLAEGCGLPLLESLWEGIPCVCSDLPVLRENADGGGCLVVEPGNVEAWCEALTRVVTNEGFYAELVRGTHERRLPLWSEAAQSLIARLT